MAVFCCAREIAMRTEKYHLPRKKNCAGAAGRRRKAKTVGYKLALNYDKRLCLWLDKTLPFSEEEGESYLLIWWPLPATFDHLRC